MPALDCTALAVEGRQAGEGRDLLSVDLAELGGLGPQSGTCAGSDSGNTLEDFVFRLPVVVGLDEPSDLRVEFEPVLLVQKSEHLTNALKCEFGGGLIEAITLSRAKDNELSSTDNKLLEFLLFFRGFLASREVACDLRREPRYEHQCCRSWPIGPPLGRSRGCAAG